ncbi:MAG: FAD-dependent oxidoreductase [Campylobacter sp.]|nr:FAD-dependent oxidoreductase [Campylobacter sp.]
MQEKHYEVIVIGAGISGCALTYMLARYTDIKNIALVAKYAGFSTLNSKSTSNSQTIHCGDIETNYTYEKAAIVKQSADMVVNYCIRNGYIDKFIFPTQKIAMGVGDKEVDEIKERFSKFRSLFPYLELYDKHALKEIEPRVVFDENAKPRPENIVAMGIKEGVYTSIDYGAMSVSLVENAKKESKICDTYLNSEVISIEQVGDKFFLETKNKISLSADYVVVNAGAHSLWLAHKMGYGKHLSSICVAGSFYMSKEKILNGKVYMVQNPKLPFAALHGDPDLEAGGMTRFGPTALVMPKLERYKGLKSVSEFFTTLNFDKDVFMFSKKVLSDKTMRDYIFRNLLFEIPIYNKKLFVKDAKKIVPSLKTEDIYYAKGFGGIRPQAIDKNKKELLFGETSIRTDEGVVFNMTPSPGATSCLGNAKEDALLACKFLGKNFNDAKFTLELC